MLTAGKILLYQKYQGDADHFARVGSAVQQAELPTKDWFLIHELTANLRLEKQGLLAESFRQKLHCQLVAECDSAETVALLQQLALPPKEAAGTRWPSWLLVGGLALMALLLAGYFLTRG